MSLEEGTNQHRQLSVYGETVKAFKAYMEAPRGKTIFIPHSDDKSQQRDLLEIFELMEEGELNFNDLEHLYSMAIESVCRTIRKAFASRRQNLSWPYFKSFLFTQFPRIIDEAEAKIKSMGHASSSIFLMYERMRRLYHMRPDFVRKVINGAVDDAPIRLEMDAVFDSADSVMTDCGMPLRGDVHENFGDGIGGEEKYDA